MTVLWGLLFGGLFLLCLAGIYFLIYSVHKLRFVSALSRGNKAVGWLISTAVILVPSALLWEVWGYMNTVIVLLHLAVFWGVAALIQWGLQKRRKKSFQGHYAGPAAVLVTVLYLAVGFHRDHDKTCRIPPRGTAGRFSCGNDL